MIARDETGQYWSVYARYAFKLDKRPDSKHRPLTILSREDATILKVFRRLSRVLRHECEHVQVFADDGPWYETRQGFARLAVYAVTGTSEGHYVHIDLVGEKQKELGHIKVLGGLDAALRIVARVSVLLDV